LVLVEQSESFGGNHVWSFFDGDVAEEHRWLVEPLLARRWERHSVHFPRRSRNLGFGYNSIRSDDLDRHVRATLPEHCLRLGRRVDELSATGLRLEGGETIEAAAVIDARGPGPAPGVQLAWQKFVGRTYRSERAHGRADPVIMDARCEQQDGYRFVYTLPFNDTELLVEDTYYSTSPVLDVPALRARIENYAEHCGLAADEAVAEETGVLPVVLGGDVKGFWPTAEGSIARLGLRGGFFHPTTGYSLPDAVRNAVLITEQDDLSGAALYTLLRGRAEALWKERRFFRLLNRMLFHAARPAERYRVLEHFYRLPEPTIARFYAGRLTRLDKFRILSGRPPVRVVRALAAMPERRA
jgi:lycopene beta-cyclase